MRNIAVYPVSPKEVVEILLRAYTTQANRKEIGSLDDMVLHDIAEAAKNPEWFKKTFGDNKYYKAE